MSCRCDRLPPSIPVGRGRHGIRGFIFGLIRRAARQEPPPDVFEVVMATGILSVVMRDHGVLLIDRTLAVLAAVIFLILLAWVLLRLGTDGVVAGFQAHDPDVVLGRLTFVAACAVLGVRFEAHAVVLWCLAGAATLGWLVLVPLAVRAVRTQAITTLRSRAHGAWLLATVGTAGLAITAADLATDQPWAGWIALSALGWVLALLFYAAITALIVWRAVAEPYDGQELEPDSWILMGALAISTVAGAHLLTAASSRWPSGGLVEATRSGVVVLWVLAGLWIPAVLAGHLWRSVHDRGLPRLTAGWFAAVFPLGMYAAATDATARQLDSSALVVVSTVFTWVAFGLWVLIAGNWIRRGVPAARGWASTG